MERDRPADRKVMFRPQRGTRFDLAQTLLVLPGRLSVFELDAAWLVAGPCGLFVLTEDRGDLAASTARAAVLADSVRLGLSDRLAWVPFVGAMCVTSEDHCHHGDSDQPCLVVPIDLLAATVSAGPVTVDADTLDELDALRYPRLR